MVQVDAGCMSWIFLGVVALILCCLLIAAQLDVMGRLCICSCLAGCVCGCVCIIRWWSQI
jgi:hypothetical protein